MGYYEGKAHEIKRPTYADYPGRPHIAEQEAAKWDRADFGRRLGEQSDRYYQAKTAEEKAAKERQRQELDAEIAAGQRERFLAPAKRAFMDNGGTEEGWAAVADDIEADIRKQMAVSAALNKQPARSLVNIRDF